MLLIGNGRVVTRDAQAPYFSDGAVAVSGETIAAVGPLAQLQEAYPQAEFLDARGGVIMPGLINAHTHIYSALARGPFAARLSPCHLPPGARRDVVGD